LVSVAPPARRTSIRQRLVGGLALLSLLVSLLVISAQVTIDYQRRVELLQQDVTARVAAVDDSLANSIRSADPRSTRLLLEGLAAIPGVAQLELRSLDDNRLLLGRAPEQALATLRFPLQHPDAPQTSIGSLQVVLHDADIRSRTAGRLRAVAVATALVVGTGCLFIFLLYRRLLVRHLEHIARHARKLGPDTLDTPLVLDRARPSGPDELDLVVDAFERMRLRMAQELAIHADNEAELELHRSRLEDLVLERTKELERARAQAERLSNTDHLSGLSNRRHFYSASQAALAAAYSARGGQSGIGVMMVDIDHFKQINDQFGHASGDRVIAEVARRLRAGMPADALVGRLGGEEFAVLVPDTDLARLQALAETVRAGLAAARISVGVLGPLSCTVSIGIAMGGNGIAGIDDLLAHADDALYRAKYAGRNRVEVWRPGMDVPSHASTVRRRPDAKD
jgi:diguanylate cyclase (GGDEF)-like protein